MLFAAINENETPAKGSAGAEQKEERVSQIAHALKD
jgi:hypothetical protein